METMKEVIDGRNDACHLVGVKRSGGEGPGGKP